MMELYNVQDRTLCIEQQICLFTHLHIHLVCVCVLGLQYYSILPQWDVTYDTNNDKKNIVENKLWNSMEQFIFYNIDDTVYSSIPVTVQ